MTTADEQTLDHRRHQAVTELTELVKQRYATASFESGTAPLGHSGVGEHDVADDLVVVRFFLSATTGRSFRGLQAWR